MIIETDLGHDPDDFFALCYLDAVGVKIRLLIITPGDLDQIAFAKFLCKELSWDIPIISHRCSDKMSSGGIHHELLRKYKAPLQAKTSDSGNPVFIENTLNNYPDCHFFIIGPPKVIGHYCQYDRKNGADRLTMQGGFLPYHLHNFPAKRLSKFEGKHIMPTFNMNEAIKETNAILSSPLIEERQFVGKNVCHTVDYNREIFNQMEKPPNRAAELFIEGMAMYLDRHDSKHFHDPLAAVLHLHPEIGSWVDGLPFREGGNWGTVLTDNSRNKVLADIDRTKFWEHITNWK